MEKIALIADSTCGLPQEYIDKYNVHIVGLKIIYKNEEYIDGVNITPKEVYSRLEEELPTTSMPSVDDVITLYEKLVTEGYTHAIVLPISSGLSGTINSFRLGSQEFDDKIKSFIYDTKILSMAVGLSVIEVGKLIEEGKSFEYICDIIPKFRENTEMYFTVDTLEYLIKGGRIGKITGGVGQLLNLKPIIKMSDEGTYTTHCKVRGSKKAFNELVKLVSDILDSSKGKVVIMTGTMHDEAQKLKEIFSAHANTEFIYSGLITPAIGIHSGPQILGIAVMKNLDTNKVA